MGLDCCIWWLGFLAITYKVLVNLIPYLGPRVQLECFSYGWAVVTGGTDGIGRAMVEYMAKAGYKVVIVSRSEEKCARVAEEVREATGNKDIEYVQADFGYSHRDAPAFYN
jgi:NADPH:quinone reductase-like Zn-dependent oxidoreductase